MEGSNPVLLAGSPLDASILTNPNISSSLSTEERMTEEVEEISSKLTSTFPMTSYIHNKKESDIFFQHPLILSMKDIKISDDFKNITKDLINKWYENSSLKNYYISLYSKEKRANV